MSSVWLLIVFNCLTPDACLAHTTWQPSQEVCMQEAEKALGKLTAEEEKRVVIVCRENKP